MSKDAPSPEMDDLARRWLELWQDQWAAMAGDPATAEAASRLFALMGQGASALMPFMLMARASADDGSKFPAWPTTAAPASDAGGAALADLARRLDRLEARLDRLEGSGDGGGSGGKGGKRKSG